MSGIRSTGRRGFTVVPNWRWEDGSLDPFSLRVAGWLASHADSYREDHVTRNEIARRTSMSGERVSKSLSQLSVLGVVSTELVESDATGQRFRITFHFSAWEGADATRPPPGRHTTAPPVATRPHREEQSLEHHGEHKGDRYADEDFVQFWSLYPHKTGKPNAWRAWKAARKVASVAIILGGLDRWRDFWETGRTEQRFIPHPATWLNDQRYDDVPPKPQKGSKSMDTLGKLARGELG